MNRVKCGTGWEFLLVKRLPAYTWNPASGCNVLNCAVRKRGVCWAEKIVKRLGHVCPKCPSFKPHMHEDRLFEPFKLRKRAVITPVSTGDLFGLPEEMTGEILIIVEKAFWHTFTILTKNPQNARRFNPYPKNVCFGVTVNEQQDTWRLDDVKKIEAPLKWCIFEPLYSPIDYDLSWLDWIVIGPQTKPQLQPEESWVQSILDNATAVPIFMKSTLKWPVQIRESPTPEIHNRSIDFKKGVEVETA